MKQYIRNVKILAMIAGVALSYAILASFWIWSVKMVVFINPYLGLFYSIVSFIFIAPMIISLVAWFYRKYL